jgi:hypothetical protein
MKTKDRTFTTSANQFPCKSEPLSIDDQTKILALRGKTKNDAYGLSLLAYNQPVSEI